MCTKSTALRGPLIIVLSVVVLVRYEDQLWASSHFQRFGRGYLGRLVATRRAAAGEAIRCFCREMTARQVKYHYAERWRQHWI